MQATAVVSEEVVQVQEDILSFTLSYRREEVPHDFPNVSTLSKLLINGRQVGLISYMEIKVHADRAFPEILVHICGGLPKEAVESCSDLLKVRAREYLAELRKFPFIRVESPFLDE